MACPQAGRQRVEATCKEGVETDLCSLTGVDHSPYGNSLSFNVADVAWKMFQRQPIR